MKWSILLLALLPFLIGAADPFQPYEFGNKPQPAVPEPSTYAQVGASLGVTAYVMYLRKKKKSS